MTIRKRTRTTVPVATPDIGYGKPPVHTRFKSGQSGNPRGRRRKELKLDPILENALRQKVTVTRNGAPSLISLFEATIEQLSLASAKGNTSSQRLLLKLIEAREAALAEANSASGSTEGPLNPADEDIIAQFRREVLAEGRVATCDAKAPLQHDLPATGVRGEEQ